MLMHVPKRSRTRTILPRRPVCQVQVSVGARFGVIKAHETYTFDAFQNHNTMRDLRAAHGGSGGELPFHPLSVRRETVITYSIEQGATVSPTRLPGPASAVS